jgi:uncharacterized protein (UPF0332 family)
MNELSRFRVGRAFECLDEATILADKKHYNACVNRLYYACFYAVNALLASKGLSSAKHAGVRGLFNQHYVKTEIIPRDLAAVFNDLFESRQESDYQDFFVVEKEAALEFIAPAERFVKHVATYLGFDRPEKANV